VDVTAFRNQMPVARKWAFMDHAAVAPLPLPTWEAVRRWSDEALQEGNVTWSRWAARVEEIRRRAAALINAQPEEIAFVPNTTFGISLVAEGFPWRDGDNVVTLSNEFPSNLYPWMHLAERGVETRRVAVEGAAVDWRRVAEACDARTRILAVSWVSYSTGWRLDLDQVIEFARGRKLHVFLDAIQGLGVFPLDVRRTPIDFLAADGHKWLLGPEGAGLFFVRRELLDRLRPVCVGWHSVAHAHDFSHIELTLRDEAARFEAGSQNMVGTLGLGASLDLLAQQGLGPGASSLADQVLAFTDLACQRLLAAGAQLISDRRAGRASGIVSFTLPGQDPQLIRKRCLEAGVVLSCRAGRLRISPHAYANEDDLSRLLEAVQHAGRPS
jgi:cysteine desulfurase / selenocysteine lyase